VDHVDAAVDARINVGPERPRKAADLCGEPEVRDGPDNLAFGIRGCGKARFDGVDSYSGELFCNTEFLFKRE
jgi:hypothetical protein